MLNSMLNPVNDNCRKRNQHKMIKNLLSIIESKKEKERQEKLILEDDTD